MAGTLYVVPNLLGVVPPDAVLPARTIQTARRLSHWVVETPKAARAFLKALDVARPIATLEIEPIAQGSDTRRFDTVLTRLGQDHDVGLLSDAGCPGVADPGAALVARAHDERIRVVPLVGPSAVLLALMASGMNGQHFCFHGYLPAKADARASALREIEQRSRASGRTELFIETPYRNAALLTTMSQALSARTRICVAADLTLDTETIESRSAAQWRNEDPARFDRRPAMFLLQA